MTAKTHNFVPRCRLFFLAVGLTASLLCAVPTAAQEKAGRLQLATPWTHQAYADDSIEFQFAIVSDRAANPREGVFKAALAKLELLRPRFVLSVGDFIHAYGEGSKPLTDEALVRAKRRNVDDALNKLSLPFYRVAGNHDVNNDMSAAIWNELYGPVYYCFAYKDVLFLCLNSQDGPNYRAGIGQEQIAWVEDTLAEHTDTRWVHVLFHQPLWLEDEKRLQQAQGENGSVRLTGFHEVEKLLEGRDYTVFAGHHHRYGKWIKNGRKYFRLATTGGQSALGGLEAGQFDHVLWVTMTAEGPVVANLLLDGILDEDAKNNMPGTNAER
jgi:3',5'-cyclic AMP phosphodiesterase CpdA